MVLTSAISSSEMISLKDDEIYSDLRRTRGFVSKNQTEEGAEDRVHHSVAVIDYGYC
jgi:hypothetical protein